MPDSKEGGRGEKERKRQEDKVGGNRKAVVVTMEEGSSAQRPDSNGHKEHFARCAALNHNLAGKNE